MSLQLPLHLKMVYPASETASRTHCLLLLRMEEVVEGVAVAVAELGGLMAAAAAEVIQMEGEVQ